MQGRTLLISLDAVWRHCAPLLLFSFRPSFKWINLTNNLAAVDIERNAGDMLGRTACEIDGRAANIARSADAKRDTGRDGKNLGI